MTEKQRELLYQFIAVFAFLLCAALLVLVPKPGTLNEVFLALTVVFGVHLIERYVLWRTIQKLVGNDLVRAAKDCNLSGIYNNRLDPGLCKEVKVAVKDAVDTVCLLGISFAGAIPFSDLVESVLDRPSTARPKDFRILLLDPFRSPAVFRTFLETTSDNVRRIVGYGRYDQPDLPFLFVQRLYQDFDTSLKVLKRHASELQHKAKYYAHNPNCWLVIADGVIYFQPYSFGKSRETGADPTLGPFLPVLRFQSGGEPFKILKDHFDKLWRTSTVDMFHIEARERNKVLIGGRMFQRRRSWFKEVYRGLSDLKESRSWTRQPCADACSVQVMWKGQPLAAGIRDSSAGGLSLELTGFSDDQVRPLKDDRLTLIRPSKDLLEMPDSFWGADFVVRWPKSEDVTTITREWNVGLERAA